MLNYKTSVQAFLVTSYSKEEMNYGKTNPSPQQIAHIQYGSTALGLEEDTLSIKPCHYKTHGFSNDPWDEANKNTTTAKNQKGKMR